VAIQLRYLQTVTEIASEKNSTIVFPLPIELLGAFGDIYRRTLAPGAPGAAVPLPAALASGAAAALTAGLPAALPAAGATLAADPAKQG
jgi:hypothetical protein